MPTTESQQNKANEVISAATGKTVPMQTNQNISIGTPVNQPMETSNNKNDYINTLISQGFEGSTLSPQTIQKASEALRTIYDSSENPEKEFLIPYLMGAHPRDLIEGSQQREYEARVAKSQEYMDLIGNSTKEAIAAGSTQAIEGMKQAITSLFGKEGYDSAYNAAQNAPKAMELTEFLTQSGMIPEAAEAIPQIDEAEYEVEKDVTPEVAGIASRIRKEGSEAAKKQNLKRQKELDMITKRSTISLDSAGRIESISIAKDPQTMDYEAQRRFKELPEGVQDWLAEQKLYKQAGIEVNKIDDETTGESYYQTISPKGDILNTSPSFITQLSADEKLAEEQVRANLPSGADAWAYRNYENRVTSKGINALPYEEWGQLQSNIDQAANIYMPKYREDPVKGLIAEKIAPGERDRRADNWATWVEQVSQEGHYSTPQLVSKTMEVLSALGYEGTKITEYMKELIAYLNDIEEGNIIKGK